MLHRKPLEKKGFEILGGSGSFSNMVFSTSEREYLLSPVVNLRSHFETLAASAKI